MTIIRVIGQPQNTTVHVSSFRSVPQGVELTSQGDGTLFLADDGNYYPGTGGGSGSGPTNLSIANKTSTTFELRSSTGTDVTIPQATTTEAGLLNSDDKATILNLSPVATSGSYTDLNNIPSAFPSNIASVSGLQSALDGKFPNPTGDTTQYIAGDGSLVAFPVVGEAGTLVRQVRNETGTTLTKGTVVYITGARGNKPTVSRALATSDATSAQTFGVVQADIPDNQNGFAVVSGDIIGINTSSFAEGDQLYLSGSVAGSYTATKPVAPLHMVYVGIVTRQHATQGQIEVAIQNGYEMDELHDVLIVSKTDKDVISYESASGLWKNKQLTSGDISGLEDRKSVV